MAKKKTISQLKKELDKIFSLYIRLRDATPEGLVKCFTCDKISHYKLDGMIEVMLCRSVIGVIFI